MGLKPLPPHSEAKIKLLRTYLEAYLGIISRDSYTEEIFLADLFCGPGMYADEKPGSPVVIGRMLGALHKSNPNAQRTTFLFNDKDIENVENAKEFLSPIEAAHDKILLIPNNQNAREVFPNLVSRQKPGRKSKKFYFVDPFGYSQITLSEIFSLLNDEGAELLLFQPCSFMFRFSEKGTPVALAGFMEELSGGNPWPRGMDIMGYIHHTKKLLQNKVAATHFVDSFTIQKDPQTVFCLFFFTRHIRGFEKMLEAKWKFNGETGQGWHFSSTHSQDDLFSKPSAQTMILERELDRLIENGKSATNAEIYRATLEQGFLPKHSNEILTAWQKLGRILVSPAPPRAGIFYLGYEEHEKKGRIIRVSKVS